MRQRFHHIHSLLKAEEITALELLISGVEFVDGKATASMAAKEVKNNLQLSNSNPAAMEAIQHLLNNVVHSSHYFQAAAQVKKYILLS